MEFRLCNRIGPMFDHPKGVFAFNVAGWLGLSITTTCTWGIFCAEALLTWNIHPIHGFLWVALMLLLSPLFLLPFRATINFLCQKRTPRLSLIRVIKIGLRDYPKLLGCWLLFWLGIDTLLFQTDGYRLIISLIALTLPFIPGTIAACWLAHLILFASGDQPEHSETE